MAGFNASLQTTRNLNANFSAEQPQYDTPISANAQSAGLNASLQTQQNLNTNLRSTQQYGATVSTGVKTYDQLSGKPELNGVTIEGNHDLAYYGIPEGDIVEAESALLFPSIGVPRTLYIDRSTNKVYRWNADQINYICVGSNYEDITVIEGGNA